MAQKYGVRDGLPERLREWALQLGRDKKYPWIGTGIIDDLRAAADTIDGKPAAPEPEPEAWEIAAQKEYDL